MPKLSHIFKKGQQKEAQLKENIKEKQKKQAAQEKDKQDQGKTAKAKKGKKSASSAIKSDKAYSAYQVLVQPHISEKSVSKNNEGKYVFEVYPNANKKKIAQAIESAYGVKVDKVNRISVSAKNKRYRFQSGTSSRNDKAVVTLKKGQEIEVLPH